jgi:septum formation protein
MASFWQGASPLLLASASVARKAVLEAAGLSVDTEPAGVDEREIERLMGPDPAPAVVAERLASEKAAAVAVRHPDRVVIGADQVLEINGRAMSKPADLAEAARQIAMLAGRTHRLHSAVALRAPGHAPLVFVEQASLSMRRLGPAEIDAYLAKVGDAACWSPGGYQVETLGIHLFDRIEGEHTTILGLPMLRLLATLRRLRLVAP